MTLLLIAFLLLAFFAMAGPTFAVINTGLLASGLRSEFLNRFENTPSNFGDLSTRIASTKDQENYRWLGTVPQVREFGNGRLAKGLRVESYDVKNLKYESTLEVDRDELSDDQTGQIRIRLGELSQRAATHKDYLLAQLLINGATSGYNSYDGVTFFNDAHASGASGSQDNNLGYDGSSVVTAAEFLAAFTQAAGAMMAFKDDVGEPMMLSGAGLVIVVPPGLWAVATQAMAAQILGSNTNVFAGMARVVMLPWLTDATKFYLLKVDGVVRPFIFQDREPIEFGALEAGSEEGWKREKYQYGVRARYRMTYGYWQYAVLTTFS